MGGTVGTVAHQLLPDYTGGVGAYALVGMGAAFAGIVRVPLTSVIMIFEMTRDYSIIVPLMISNLMSFYISYKLQEEPIYEALQHQDGLHLPQGLRYRQGLLTVADAASSPARLLSPHDRIEDALTLLSRDRNAFPVADGQRLLGMVTLARVQEVIAAGHGQEPLEQIISNGVPDTELNAEDFPHVHMDHPVDMALRRMAHSKMNVLPVVSRSDVRELRGVVTLPDILRAYGVAEEERQEKTLVPAPLRVSRRLLPAVVGVALTLLILIGFLNYYYRSARGARAEQSYKAGMELVQQGRNEEAVEEFRDALSVSPGTERYRLALGLTLVQMGRTSEGAVYLREVLARDPENGPANLGLAQVAVADGNKVAAVTYYNRAINGVWPKGQEQNRLEARFQLAAYLAKQGDQTQAIAQLLAALGQAKDVSTRERIGRLLLEYGAPQQAGDLFRGLIHANAGDAAAYAGLGDAELARNDYSGARDAFQKAARLDPSNDSVQKQLQLVSRVLALDPQARGIRTPERYQRSDELLRDALMMAEACPQAVQDNADLVATAQKSLAQHPSRRALDDATDDNLNTAVQLWKARQRFCAAQPASDEAAARVLARLAQE